MTSRTNQGFSLLELMMVVLIGSILAVLALPAFRTYIARSNLSQTANGLLVAFNVARAEAIKRNVYVRVDPASCGGAANWAFGAFVWTPATPADAVPTSMPDARIISGTAVADGASCNSGNKITASTDTTFAVCYNGSGKVNLNSAAAACATPNAAQPTCAWGAGANSFCTKLCDSAHAVPTGSLLVLSQSGRTSIQPNITCP